VCGLAPRTRTQDARETHTLTESVQTQLRRGTGGHTHAVPLTKCLASNQTGCFGKEDGGRGEGPGKENTRLPGPATGDHRPSSCPSPEALAN
jgi:hypothetical protein